MSRVIAGAEGVGAEVLGGAEEAAGAAADATGVGLPLGVLLHGIGIGTMAYGAYKLGQAIKGDSSSSSSDSSPDLSSSSDSSSSSFGSSNSGSSTSITGAQLAPLVVSTIIALQPYMNQIRSYLGQPASTNSSTASSTSSSSSNVDMKNVTVGKNWEQGLVNLSTGGPAYAKALGRVSGGASASSMGFTGAQDDFVQKMYPYAQQVSQATGLPVDMVLAQCGLESGWGTSEAANENNNFAGIKPWGNYGPGPDSEYAGYTSIQDFANGYINFLTQNSRYRGLLSAARSGASEEELVQILGSTGYAEDPGYARKILGTIPYVQRAIKVSGSVTVNLRHPDGTVQKVNVPIKASYTGMLL
ncbi:glucosaminidase domain-containing protein [Collibacillus ludicampi]|nr:glucosaminidase domain-containing protein [Collibacillus ludicampi]